jgi:hypothetical protein
VLLDVAILGKLRYVIQRESPPRNIVSLSLSLSVVVLVVVVLRRVKREKERKKERACVYIYRERSLDFVLRA